VILHPDDGAIPYLKPLMTKALQENGISVVGDVVSYPNELVDFSPIASKLAARKADAIFNPNAIGQQVGPILKGLRELGDNRWFFYCGVGKCSDIKNLAGAAAKNLVTLAIMPGAPGNPPQLEAWVKRLYAKVGEERSLIVQNSSGTWVLPQILQAAQSLDPAAIKEAMNRIDKVETLWGPGRICGEKTYGIRHAVAHPLPSQFIDEKGEIKFGGWMTDIYVP
jgi:ABC-type branched-subunit amino acid transport system substrate-binding protein